jgi:hypothetical protein
MVAVKPENSRRASYHRCAKIDPIEVDGVTYAIIEDRFIKNNSKKT